MSISIGKKIKELRRSQDVTQEKLAEYLNITYQAVSRWENELAYPDITLLPAIANFFGISADKLLGMKGNEDEEELNEYTNTYQDNWNKGKLDVNIALCREVLAKYPRNYRWMDNLTHCLLQYNAPTEEEKIANYEEAIAICERIREDCTDDKRRSSVTQTLVMLYSDSRIGKKDLARAIVEQLPSMYVSKDFLLGHVYTGEEWVKQKQGLLERLADSISQILRSLSYNNSTLSFDEKNQHITIANKIFDLIFDGEENSLFHSCRYSENYRHLARRYCQAEHIDKKKAIEYLILAEKAAKRYDDCEGVEEQFYKSAILNKSVYYPGGTMKDYEESEVGLVHYFIKDNKCFENLGDHPDFIALMERLEGAK